MAVEATIVDYPTIKLTKTITVTVIDPCLTTSLIAPAALNDMTTSVSVASGAVTQLIGALKDQVSVSFGDSTGT